jgi:hypothetical protein
VTARPGRRLASFIAVIAIGAGAVGALAAAPTRRLRLPAQLVLRDGRQGFVGESGSVTTIDRDGRYRVAGFVNDRIQPPHLHGVLRADAIRELARAWARVNPADLPAVMSRSAAANPHRLQLSVGKRTSTLTLLPGETAQEAAAALRRGGTNPATRFLDLWITAQKAVAREVRKKR